jgi:hypothetical protein
MEIIKLHLAPQTIQQIQQQFIPSFNLRPSLPPIYTQYINDYPKFPLL